MTGRIERLGREISIIKAKQGEHTISLEDVAKKIDFTGYMSEGHVFLTLRYLKLIKRKMQYN